MGTMKTSSWDIEVGRVNSCLQLLECTYQAVRGTPIPEELAAQWKSTNRVYIMRILESTEAEAQTLIARDHQIDG